MMIRTGIAVALLTAALASASPARAQPAPPDTLQHRVDVLLRASGPGTRFGLVVAAEDGRELVAIAPEGRFMPASNTKILTTAAAYATLTGLDRPDVEAGATVRLNHAAGPAPDVILEGGGDARLSSAPDCVSDCLAFLADAVAARARTVRDVIGDASLFPDQRWSPGMSWNNIPTRSGTGIAALSLDDNELRLRISPGEVGGPPTVDALAYYNVANAAVTVPAGDKTELAFDRSPNGKLLRLTGTIARDAEPELLRVGIDDPAEFAAWRLKAMLEARGVRVTGHVRSVYRTVPPFTRPLAEGAPPAPALARLVPPPLADDVAIINKASQNLHAELLIRRLGLQRGTGSIADGVAAVGAMLDRAGVPRAAWDLSDGSGMSTYNRVAPRGMLTLLRWIAAQHWGAAWRATLPVGGVDGTLSGRFKGTSLENKVFAKTGSINATSALSGYMIARSGRTLIFSAFANDVPEGAGATAAIDAALVMIAEEN
jgi:D-alanyl-D-alanine carboxypeptidase/D-alanyl-D-alanine-endopeptidase (penicillin-binding protein 4)